MNLTTLLFEIITRKLVLLICSGSIFFTCTSKSGGQQEADERNLEKPNIIFILVDDLGYGDIGCFGQQKIHNLIDVQIVIAQCDVDLVQQNHAD